jgi:hypothetical protein
MMRNLKVISTAGRLVLADPPVAKESIKPLALTVLPQHAGTNGLLLSMALHVAGIAALVWMPALFPAPVVLDISNCHDPARASNVEPLLIPSLPQFADQGQSSTESSALTRPGHSVASPLKANSQPPKRDYPGPQEIVSDLPNAVNRVQTIRRPDLVTPAEMKFPLRLQSMVILPPPATPVLVAPREESRNPAPPLATVPDELPVAEATVENPVLLQTSKRIAVAPSEAVPATAPVMPQSTSTNLSALAQPHLNLPKAVVVVNAVSVPPDPAAQIPDAQLAGNFVVGPSHESGAGEKPSGNGTGRDSEGASPNSGERPLQPGMDIGAGTGSASGHPRGVGRNPGTGISSSSPRETESGSGTTGHASGNGAAPGISISGGIPGRNGAVITKTMPLRRSYGMTIIAGGSSGGASRDMGVFDRSETVYGVAIPMADAGGGPDWPMQYALLNREQHGAGLLVPPFAQKKVAATTSKAQLLKMAGPVFVSGTIDESGRLQALRSIRTQDARSQPAIHALAQWEFLPARLDGRAVASKVLIGVTVIAGE